MDVSIFYLCILCVCLCVCMCYMDVSLVISVLCVCVLHGYVFCYFCCPCVCYMDVSLIISVLCVCVLHMWYTHCMNNCRGQSLASGYLPQLLFHLAVLLLLCGKFEGHLFVLKWDLSLNQKLTIS